MDQSDTTGSEDSEKVTRAPKWRKRPVEIDAWRFFAEETMPTWLSNAISGAYVTLSLANDHTPMLSIMTLEGVMTARAGDWIIRGVKGELYPCRHDIFEATYEPAA